MKKIVAASLFALMLVGAVYAQDPYSGLDQTLQPSAAVAAPNATGAVTAQNAPPAAPYYDGTYVFPSYQNYTDYNNARYYQHQAITNQYNAIQNALSRQRQWYPSNSYQRQVLDQQIRYGEEMYVRYNRYQDASALYALQQWMASQQGALYQYGGNYQLGNGAWWNTNYYGYQNYQTYPTYYTYSVPNYTYRTYTYRTTYPTYYRYPNYNYNYTYPRVYYGGLYRYSDTYYHGVGLGDSIGHIVAGSRYNNDTEMVGGILGTAGNVLSIIGNVRR